MTTDGNKVIELAGRRQQRSALQVAREQFVETFRILLEQYGLPEELAAEKASIVNEMIETVCGVYTYKISLTIPIQLDDQQDRILQAAIERWSHEFHLETVSRCLESFGGRLVDLALPKGR